MLLCLVQFADCEKLQVWYLQHVGGQESSLQQLHISRVQPAAVDVAQHEVEHCRRHTLDGDRLHSAVRVDQKTKI